MAEEMMAELQDHLLCVDRVVSLEHKPTAAELAITENERNEPQISRLPGVSVHPLKLALFTGKMWKNGRHLRVHFLDGSPLQRQKTEQLAREWCDYANVAFD